MSLSLVLCKHSELLRDGGTTNNPLFLLLSLMIGGQTWHASLVAEI